MRGQLINNYHFRTKKWKKNARTDDVRRNRPGTCMYKKKKTTNECQVEQTESLNTNVTFSSC